MRRSIVLRIYTYAFWLQCCVNGELTAEQAMIAGGTGGTCGDMLMHSLDTVKTRQQGDPHIPSKYTSMGSSYATIYRQEGLLRGLYGGVTPALIGSFPGTVIFFGSYEFTKRRMLDSGINADVAYLSSGKLVDPGSGGFPCRVRL